MSSSAPIPAPETPSENFLPLLKVIVTMNLERITLAEILVLREFAPEGEELPSAESLCTQLMEFRRLS